MSNRSYYYCLPIKDGYTREEMLHVFTDYAKVVLGRFCQDEELINKVSQEIDGQLQNVEETESSKVKTILVSTGEKEELYDCQFATRIMKSRANENAGMYINVAVENDEENVPLTRFIENAIYYGEQNFILIKNSYVKSAPFNTDDNGKDVILENTFAAYLCNKHILGKSLNLRISQRAIGLRYEDGEMLKKLFAGDIMPDVPTVIVRDEKIDADKIAKKLCGTVMVFYDQDSDAFEDIEDSDFRVKIIYEDGTTMWSEKNNMELATTEDVINEIIQRNWTRGFDTDNFELQNMLIDESLWLMDKMRETYFDCRNALKDYRDKYEKEKIKNGKPIVPFTYHQAAANTGSINLEAGNEKDLYDGEMRAIVIASLREYRNKYVTDNSRRAHVLDSILNATTDTSEYNNKKQTVEDTFKKYESNYSPKMIKEFEKCGFKVRSSSGHIKMKWMDDPRYLITMASTPSDHSSIINAEKETIKKIF